MSSDRLPVVVLGGTDEADLSAAVLSAQLDLPDAVTLRLELDAEAGTVRRVVHDATGTVDDRTSLMEHACHSCALREELVPALLELAGADRWPAALVVLPLGAELLPVGTALGTDVLDERVPEHLEMRAVTAVVDPAGLVERVVAGTGGPEGAEVTAAVVAQLEYADVVVHSGHEAAPQDLTLLRHLARADALHVDSTLAVDGPALLAMRHDVDTASRCTSPLHRRPTGAEDADGITTVVLESWRPLHPHRLMEAMEPMVLASLRTRGAFWLPSRPDSVLAWDECCGQLRLGECARWDGKRRTHLVVTAHVDDVEEVRAAFEHALMTDAEMVGAAERWVGRPDGFEEWAGAA